MRLIISFIVLFIFTHVYSQTWTNNGPFGAKITSIASDPSDSTIIYAGTYGKGIYKSVDSGESWFLINNGLPQWQSVAIGSPTLPSWWFGDHYPVITIAVRPDNPQFIYAGLKGGGIAFSKDQGFSWQSSSGLPDSANVTVFWIAPGNPSNILCGLNSIEYGLYKSIDGGANFSVVEQVKDSSGFGNVVKDIQHVPSNSDSIFVSVGRSLFLSVDASESWQLINQQLGFDRLLLIGDGPVHILAIVDTGFEDNVLMHSTDGGQNWNIFPEGEFWDNISAIEEDINGHIYVYRQDQSKLWISTDTGLSWDSQPLISDFGELRGETSSLNSFLISPHNPMTIYIGTQAGLFKSVNGGANYVLKENGMINSYINDIAVNPQSPNIAYAGGENGLWKTENSGQSWQRLSLMNVNAIALDKKHPDTLYISADSLVKSIDGGDSFSLLLYTGKSISEVEIHPKLNNVIFVGVYPSTVKKSLDLGLNLITSFSPDQGSFRIKDIKFSQTNDSLVYFGTDYNQLNHGLYKSVDLGENWEKISDPGLVKEIVLSSTSSDTVYVCTSNNIQVSADGGQNFTIMFDSISSNMSSLYNLVGEHTMLATTKNKGAFILNLNTKTFQEIPGNYDPRLSALKLYSEKDFYFATHGDGVWLGKNVVTSVGYPSSPKTIPHLFDILKNYPNPFNISTKFLIQVNNPLDLSISIFSISGQIIKTYPRTKYNAGVHTIEWDGLGVEKKTISSGVYILSVSDGRTNRFHKIILLK
jgi:photosystem II stability/assembly factor-like uncharacterized protein